jgi:arylsulfatase
MIDIVPTILEATGIQAPNMVDGIAQKPIEGVSMAYTFDEANANAPSTRHTQYFEMLGNRGIYHDGWYANTKPINPPWNLTGIINPDVINAYQWELYDVSRDWTQNHDLAASNPAKLKEMQDLFMLEAAKYQVFPMDDSLATRMVAARPSVTAGRNVFTYSGVLTGTPNGDAPMLLNSSYTIKAEVDVPEGGGDGMLVTQGGRFAGWGFYLLAGKPVYVWNLLDLERVRWAGKDALRPGKHTLEFDFTYDGMGMGTLAFNSTSGLGRGGTGVLKVDRKEVARQTMERSIPITLQWDENFDIGADTLTGVDDRDYQPPFAFNGTIDQLTITIDRPQLSPEDIKKLQAALPGASNKASE